MGLVGAEVPGLALLCGFGRSCEPHKLDAAFGASVSVCLLASEAHSRHQLFKHDCGPTQNSSQWDGGQQLQRSLSWTEGPKGTSQGGRGQSVCLGWGLPMASSSICGVPDSKLGKDWNQGRGWLGRQHRNSSGLWPQPSKPVCVSTR